MAEDDEELEGLLREIQDVAPPLTHNLLLPDSLDTSTPITSNTEIQRDHDSPYVFPDIRPANFSSIITSRGAVVSISADPTLTFSLRISSHSHPFFPSSSLPPANATMIDSPYQHHHSAGVQQQQQMPQPPLVTGASSASHDPEKGRLIKQQLVLLLHAHHCQQREREQHAHAGFRPCTLPHCRTFKNILNHMTQCQAGRDCQFPHCASSRQILYHWRNCNQQECPICMPLRNTTRPNVGSSIGRVPNSMFGSEVPPASLTPHLVPTATGTKPSPPGQNPFLSQAAGQPQGGGVKPNPVGSAGPLPSSTSGPMVPNQSMPPNHARAWHAEVNLDLRNHLIKKLVEAIYPVPNLNMHDSRVKSLFQYAAKVESMFFDNASSREDYYQKLAEKIYHIRKELDERRKTGAPSSFPDDGSDIITALPHMKGQPSPHAPLSETNKILKELISSTPQSLMGGTIETLKAKLKIDDSELYSKGISSPSDSSSSLKKPVLTVKKEKFSPPTPIHPSYRYSPLAFCDEKKPAASKIKHETLQTKLKIDDSELYSKGISSPSDISSSLKKPILTVKKEKFSPPTPTLPSYSPLAFCDEKKPAASKIKLDPRLVKIFTPDELENALMPVFNVVMRQEPESYPFRQPVNPIDLGIPDYFDIIKNPIDLSVIQEKLENGCYSNPWQFCDDMQLMFDNAWTYNNKESRVYKFCSKLHEIFYENIDKAMVSLGYCCGQKYFFHPQVLYCDSKSCPIPIDSPYYGYQDKYMYVCCTKCFTESPGDKVALSLDGTSNISLPKGTFKEMKNDSVELEPMVVCIHCRRSFHKICVLHHDDIWPEGYQCCDCLQSLKTSRTDNRFVAKRLPTTKLGLFLEECVNSFLEGANVPGAEVIIRVLSSSDKLLDTRLGMMDRFSSFPSQFPYRTKALFAFQEIDGAEVCFFGMHVQEYGSDCPAPNTRRVYISYLDSLPFFKPKEYQTLVNHEILLGYLKFCKQNGFQTAHMWACPPAEDGDYIFYCHPMEQEMIKPKRPVESVEWYRNMLERGKAQSVLFDFQDIFQYCVEEKITTVDIPYFEGDFWPNLIEETIKELDQERKASEALSVDNASSRTEKRKKGGPLNYNPLVSGDDVTLKIMKKHKEIFFVAYLQPPYQIKSLPTTTDPDSLVTRELMDGCDAFLNLAREKHWEFSSLRRAKFSTMSMLYELHNQGERFIYFCNNCSTDMEFRWHCKECEDYNLCSTCYHKIGHEHPMEKLGFNMGDEDSKFSSTSTTVSHLERQQRQNEFLIHACQCRDSSCSEQLCIKMKQLLRHARDCKMRTSGKCTACNFFIKLCATHAQECHEIKCPVPLCASLKKETREKRLREQAKSFQLTDQPMSRSHISPPTTPSEPNPATPFTLAEDSSSPNVTAQPPGLAMQTPQNNIHKLVQAFCSPSPQDNLKAKEYLRGHTDLVPRVIQGLQYLSRDKEVLYLQHEFGSYVSRLPHPQQTVGGGAYMSPQVRLQASMQPMQTMQRSMMPSSSTMMPDYYRHYPGGNPYMTHTHMPYQGQPMAGPGHSHLQHMLQGPQYSSYGMQPPPPQHGGGQPMTEPHLQNISQHPPSHSMQPLTHMDDSQLNDTPDFDFIDLPDVSSFLLNTGLNNIPRKQVSSRTIKKWLKEGSVELTVTHVNIHGPPGSGKTCAQHLLLNEDPPTDHVTDSTPIAHPTVRATRVSVDNLKWEKVTRAGLLEKLASDLNVAAASHPGEHIKATSPLCAQQPEQDLFINSASMEINETVALNNEASSISSNDETETLIQEILDLIQRSAVQLSGGHWLYIIDSGGHPAYQELLPLFIRTNTLNILTLDLSQPLDKKLDFHYRIGGETISCGLNFKYSNREFFQSAVSSGAILKTISVPHILETPLYSMHFVLGTHYDLISQDMLKKIDQELMSSLNHCVQNIVHNELGESIIFPVNTLISVDEGRMEARQKLCQLIANQKRALLKIKMPIRWFAFELWLQKVAENKSRNFLIIDEVISAGTRFKMSENDTKDALQCLHSATIVLYFPDILPRLVFIDPQPILEILSRLLALTYVERNALHLITNPVPLDEDINKLCDIGFFQEKLFYHLKSDVKLFFPPHFEPSHLIKLLIYLHVITKEKEDYFFPYALQSYTNLSVPQTETKPLLIAWKNVSALYAHQVPRGMFPLLITHLLNENKCSFKVEFPPLQPQYYKYRDALSLWINIKGKRHTFHIINRYTHIEVYFDGSPEEAKKNCPYIREVVMTAVKKSANAINVIPNHINAFYCPKKKNCYCVVDEDYFVNCTLCTRSADISEDDESYWCWFGLLDYDPKVVTSDSKYSQALDIQVLDEILTDMKEGRLSVQFDYLTPQTDSLDSNVLIAGQKLFILQGDRSHSLQWEKYGFRLQCPQGAVFKDTEVAVTAIAGGNFKVPKGTMLVSAVYAISVSNPLLKPLVIELQHCVDLRYKGQTRCLKFVSGPLKHPYQLSPVGGGSFSVGNRFGSIKRDTFSFNAIVAEMSDGDTDSDGGTPSEGSDDEDTDSSKEVMEMDEGPPVDVGTENGATESENIIKFRKRKGSESIVDDLPLKKTFVGQKNVQSVSSTNEQGSLSKPISKSTAAPSSSDSNRLILQSEVGVQVNSENNVTHNAVLYTGMMYYEEKEVGHWIAIYSVVRDLDVLIQYCNIHHPSAEKDFVVDVFKFIESNGSIRLILSTTEHEGWKVHANREQMKLLQSTIDMFSSNPLYSSFSMDVHAKVGVAQDPLHYPIKIIGIDPEKTIYINRPPPPPTYKISPTSTASISQTRRETEEGVTYDSEKASKVITENALLIKGCGINLHFLVDKLLEHGIINAREKGEITDGYTRQTANERMDELLHIISSSINMDGKVFGIFLSILRKEGTIRTNTLADKLMGKYNLHKTE